MQNFDRDLAELLKAAAEAYRDHGSKAGVATADALASPDLNGVRPANSTVAPHVRCSLEIAHNGPLAGLASALEAVSAGLPWRERLARPEFEEYDDNYSIAAIIGPEAGAMIQSNACRFGTFSMAPGTFYPPHSHEAEELYLVLGGTADWRMNDAPFASVAPGTFVHHAPWASHAMHTGAEPMLALWSWCGNLDPGTFRMDE